MDESDEEDDTAIQMNACGEAPETPPAGFTYAPCQPLDTLTDKAALVGRRVLTARIDDGACGWPHWHCDWLWRRQGHEEEGANRDARD